MLIVLAGRWERRVGYIDFGGGIEKISTWRFRLG